MPETQVGAHRIDQPIDTHVSSAQGDASVPFDFRRSDRIPQSQLSAIHFLHEHFVRAVVSSLTVSLRSYVSGTLLRVEQVPFGGFADALPSPTCVGYLSMPPFDGYSLLEINPSLVAPILDLVLGGTGRTEGAFDREITEVEENMMEGVFAVLVHDLVETWKPVVPVAFALEAIEARPQRSNRIPRNEGVVALTMELQIAEQVGTVNLVIPAVTLKLMHRRFDQHWAVHKAGSRDTELAIRRRMAHELMVDVDCELPGARIRLRELQALKVGDVIGLGITTGSPVTVVVAGKPKFRASITPVGARMAVTIESTQGG